MMEYISKAANSLGKAASYTDSFLGGMLIGAYTIHILPTFHRFMVKGPEEVVVAGPGTRVPPLGSMAAGFLGSMAVYGYLVQQSPKYLLIPVATNLASAIYETFRKPAKK